MKEPEVVKILKSKLKSLGLEEDERNFYRFRPDILARDIKGDLVAIEAKGSNFPRGSGEFQAYNYSKYVTKSFLAIPSSQKARIAWDYLDKIGVGLILVSESGDITIETVAKKNPNPLPLGLGKKVQITLSLDQDVIEWLNKTTGRSSRSKFLNSILLEEMERLNHGTRER